MACIYRRTSGYSVAPAGDKRRRCKEVGLYTFLHCRGDWCVGAAQGPVLVVMGGRMLDTGWFRSRAGSFLNDVVVMGRDAKDQRVAWQAHPLSAPGPAPREFHSLTPLPSHRFLLFGGT